VPLNECFASLPVIALHVKKVPDELTAQSVEVKDVFMTSDEKDPDWWQEVGMMGWLRLGVWEIVCA
jgi:hypothetical protein